MPGGWLALAGLVLLCLLAWGLVLGQRRHRATKLMAIGEALRLDGRLEAAVAFYRAAGQQGVDMPGVPVALELVDQGSQAELMDHPLAEDVQRQMADAPGQLAAWLEAKGMEDLAETLRATAG